MKVFFKRLQGGDWYEIKNTLTLIKYFANKNGNIKGIYKAGCGKVYSHWLSDVEKVELYEKRERNEWT